MHQVPAKTSRLKSWAPLCAAAAALGIYAWSWWGSPAFGLLADQPYHLHLAQEFDRAWHDGDFPPHWAAGANGGRGSAAFVVYPPLFAFLTACWMRAGLPAVQALRLAAFTSALGILGAILYLARAWLSWRRSVLAAAITLLLPGVAFLALGRGMFPHFAALAWVALLLGAGQRALLGRRVRRNALLTVLAAAGLVLTHTLTAYLLLVLLLAISPLLGKTHGLRTIAWAGLLAVAAAALTAWFWLPAFQAASYTRLNYLSESHPYLDSVFGVNIAFGESLPHLHGPFQRDWAFLNDIGRSIVIAQSLLALLLTLALRRNSASAPILFLRTLPWAAALSLFFATAPGALLLLALPRAAIIQFCWRWQTLVALWCGPALASLPCRKQSTPTLVFTGATIALFSPLFLPSESQPPAPPSRLLPPVLSKAGFERLPPIDRAAYAGNLIEQRPNATDSNDYLPAPFGVVEVVGGAAQVAPQSLKTSYRAYRITATGEATLRIRTYQAPGWTARLDSQPVEIQPDPSTGLQLVRVPPGTHRLELSYRLPGPFG